MARCISSTRISAISRVNPFFTTREKGSGLGLAIVRKTIEGHNGTIAIESEEWEGTKVKVRLPRKG